MKQLAIALLPTAIALAACERPQDEFIAALPDRDTMTVKLGETNQSKEGLSVGSSKQALVGAPAEWYTNTYYAARDLNTLAGFIIQVIEDVTQLPPSGLTDTTAVWGPLSDPKEPNEFLLSIEKRPEGDLHYVWSIKGKHKSEGAESYIALAAGAFEPGRTKDQGKGWFVIDFEHIRALDPTSDARGHIGYALEKNDDGTVVLAHLETVDANGTSIDAGYAYGEDNDNNGFIVFRIPADIDDGKDGKVAQEDVLIRTRFSTNGGRADVFATNGDLGNDIVIGSQCWSPSYVSSFEQFKLGDKVLAAAGDGASCVFGDPATPAMGELPSAERVASPYALEDAMK